VVPPEFNIVVGLAGDAVAVSVSGDLDSDSAGRLRAVLYGILHLEHRRVEAWLVVRDVALAEFEGSEALLDRLRQVPFINLREVRGLKDQDILLAGQQIEVSLLELQM